MAGYSLASEHSQAAELDATIARGSLDRAVLPVPDPVFSAYSFTSGKTTFHRARRSTRDELAYLLDALSRRVVRLLERRGLLIAEPEYPELDLQVGSSLD